ncbi:hypothetical protein SAMN05720465_0242 [Fibrobacter sp. UWB10]|nr:hypothetical protein SAMN05720465_0242 [Fibrobacter sp. UWB10]
MGFLFVLTQVGMRTLGEGSINCAKAKRSELSAVKDYGQRS